MSENCRGGGIFLTHTVDCKWAYTYWRMMMWDGQLSNHSAIVQARHSPCSASLCKIDAKKILTASPLENRRRPPARLRTIWMKTIQQDLKSSNLSLNEAIGVVQNHLLWRLVWRYALLVVHARNEWMLLLLVIVAAVLTNVFAPVRTTLASLYVLLHQDTAATGCPFLLLITLTWDSGICCGILRVNCTIAVDIETVNWY